MNTDLVLDVVMVGAMLLGIVYVQGMINTIETEGCEKYWMEYKGVNASSPEVELKKNASVSRKRYEYKGEINENDVNISIEGLEPDS